MAKQSGLGDALYIAGYDLSGDSNDVSISCSTPTMDSTGLDKAAMERLGLVRDSSLSWASFWNPTGAHPVLSALPTAQTLVTYCRSTVLGAPAFSHQALQVGYDPKRDADGSLTMSVESVGSQYAGEWGIQLTPGIRTDTAAVDGTSVHDVLAATTFGAQAYLHLFSCTAVDATITVQDSPDNAAWSDLVAFTPVATGSAPTWERVATSATETVNQYLRVITSTTGGITSLACAVMVDRNVVATVF